MTEMIGRLRVALGLETASFERGAKRASAEITTLGTRTEKAALHVGNMTKAVVAGGAAIAGLAVVSKLREMVTEGLAYASSLGETAKQLGVTTAALQEYRFVASQTGIEESEMDAALAKLTKTTGEAARGSKKAVDAFGALGISVRDANGNVKDAGALIPEIADALQKVGSEGEKASLGAGLFGKSFQTIMPMMAEGGRGINKLRNEAKELGIVLSDEMVANADDAADKMDKLNRVMSAQIAAAVSANAKEIAAFTQTLTNFAVEAIKAFNAWTKFNGVMDERVTAKKIFGKKIDKLADENNWSPETKAKATAVGNSVLDKHYGVAPIAKGGGNSLFSIKTVTPRTNLVGGGIMQNGGIGAIANMQGGAGIDGNGKTWADEVWQQTDRLAAIQGTLADDSRQTADKVEVANVRIAKSFGEMSQDSLSAMQSLVSAVQGGGVLNILQAVIGLGTNIAGLVGGNGMPSASGINKMALGSLRGTSLPTMPSYAKGTNFHPGGLAMVGEVASTPLPVPVTPSCPTFPELLT